MAGQPSVSIIVPVHDALPELRGCLDSVLAQDIPPGVLELVAVDDGSTDGSGAVLDSYAAGHQHLTVLHQAPSGGPGAPRNRGLELARGEYVFFLDADDRLGDQAVRRMLAYAHRYGCDVVCPRTVATGGRFVHEQVWSRNRRDLDLRLAFLSLTAQKLFRRALLDRHRLRFCEEPMPLEDAVLVARAYLLADRVSALGDYDYYYLQHRPGGGHVTQGRRDPFGQARAVSSILESIQQLAADPRLADQLVADVYRRKLLLQVGPNRLPRRPAVDQSRWVRAGHQVASDHVPPRVDALLPQDARLRSLALRTGDVAGVVALVHAQRDAGPPVRARRARAVIAPEAGGMELDVTGQVPLTARVVAGEPTSTGVSLLLAVRAEGMAVAPEDVRVQVAGSGSLLATGSVAGPAGATMRPVPGELLLHVDLVAPQARGGRRQRTGRLAVVLVDSNARAPLPVARSTLRTEARGPLALRDSLGGTTVVAAAPRGWRVRQHRSRTTAGAHVTLTTLLGGPARRVIGHPSARLLVRGLRRRLGEHRRRMTGAARQRRRGERPVGSG